VIASNKNVLSVVVPVYKEESSIKPFINRCIPVLSQISENYELIFVLDPSPDMSEKLLTELTQNDNRIKLLVMSRRFGQPAATMAGLAYSSGQRVVVIDIDLQDPPELILSMYQKMDLGFDVVYATRIKRDGETRTKRLFASIGYRVINKLSEVQIPRNTGDFRIMSKRVVKEIIALNEKHAFLRGLVAYVGFNQTSIEYNRDPRFAGKGNYNKYWGSLKIGINGLVGFSSKPLNYLSILGSILSVVSFLFGSWYLFQKLFGVSLTPGLSTTVILVSFLSGIQLLSLGLMGEYVTRIYDEVKNRPTYIVKDEIGFDK
jgi:glycosyltransferase involved in cell wall biosynthesis